MIEDQDMQPAGLKPLVTIDDVDKIDLRVGTVVAVDNVEGSRKLLKLRVDFGDHQRSILSGMRQEREDPSALVGNQAMFIVNMAPRKMAGEISQGMLFDVGFEDGVRPALCQPERRMPNGARAG